VRVVAGLYGGRRLEAPRGRSTRPTADRVREALFSILGPIDDARVLDLFAGSGALGIEALSRGARAAVFVDSDAPAVSAVRRTHDALGIDAATVHEREAIAWLRSAARGEERFDLVFADPPYSSAGQTASRLSELLPPLLTDSSRIVTESDKRAPLAIALPLLDERTYGDTRIAIHRAG
jgi:16S rRNA (guanine966-N2)-methyltransferase